MKTTTGERRFINVYYITPNPRTGLNDVAVVSSFERKNYAEAKKDFYTIKQRKDLVMDSKYSIQIESYDARKGKV